MLLPKQLNAVTKVPKTLVLVLLVVVILTSAIVAIMSYKNNQSTSAKYTNINPSIKWRDYSNKQFSFVISIPNEWKVKEYPYMYVGDPLVSITFGQYDLPDSWGSMMGLPDDKKPYFHISIFPVTDKDNYELFQKRMNKIGSSPYFKMSTLGGIKGVDSWLSVSVEKDGYVYDMNFSDPNNRNSELTRQVISSFRFIN